MRWFCAEKGFLQMENTLIVGPAGVHASLGLQEGRSLMQQSSSSCIRLEHKDVDLDSFSSAHVIIAALYRGASSLLSA